MLGFIFVNKIHQKKPTSKETAIMNGVFGNIMYPTRRWVFFSMYSSWTYKIQISIYDDILRQIKHFPDTADIHCSMSSIVKWMIVSLTYS